MSRKRQLSANLGAVVSATQSQRFSDLRAIFNEGQQAGSQTVALLAAVWR